MSRYKHLAVGILSVIILAMVIVVISRSQIQSSPATTPLPQTGVQQITPTDELHVTGIAPEVDIVEYRLIVDGLVDTPLTLTYEAIMEYPTVTEVVRLVCPDWFIDNAEWTGVPVATLLAEASVKPEASQVVFHALDGYRATLLIEEVQGDGVFLAHTVNGEILPAAHGYPLRLVVRDSDGNKWVKWLERIEVK